MRNIILIIVLNLFYKVGICESNLEFGLQYEPQRTWILNSDYKDRYTYQTTSGEAYGLSFVYYDTTKFILESGIIFSNQGQKFTESRLYNYNSTYDSTTLNIHFDLRYIKIPVLPGISGNRSNKIFGNVNLGLQFSILNSATLIVEDTKQSPYNYNETTDFKDTYKAFTIDAALRLGINIHVTEQMLFSTLLSMDQSLSNIDKSMPVYNFPASYNRTFGGIFRISYIF